MKLRRYFHKKSEKTEDSVEDLIEFYEISTKLIRIYKLKKLFPMSVSVSMEMITWFWLHTLFWTDFFPIEQK